jgi:hypothetical protein
LLPSLVASNVLIHVAKEFHNEAMLLVTGCELMTNLAAYNVFKDLVHKKKHLVTGCSVQKCLYANDVTIVILVTNISN